MPSTCKPKKKHILNRKAIFVNPLIVLDVFYVENCSHFWWSLSTLFLQQQQYKSTKYLVQKQSRTMSAIYLCTIHSTDCERTDFSRHLLFSWQTIIHRESRATIFSFILVHQITILNPIHTECRHKWKNVKNKIKIYFFNSHGENSKLEWNVIYLFPFRYTKNGFFFCF